MQGKAFYTSRKWLVFVLLFIFIITAMYGNAFSVSNGDDQIKVLLNGEKLQFDVNPYIKGGRTLVPFRKIFEAFGMDVQWNGTNQTVLASNDKTEINLKINDKTAYVNKIKKELDVAPEITKSRTFVPLRFIGESLGADVKWDGDTKTVTITSSGGSTTSDTLITPNVNSTPTPDTNSSIYKLGQTVSYADFTFSLDNVDLKLAENSLILNGKISNADKGILIYVYDSSGNYIYANVVSTESSDNMYKFTANAFIASNTNFKEVKYIEIKVMTDDKKAVRIATYVP